MMYGNYRRAALRLHGLSDTDRGWILGQLPAKQSQRLEELVDELRGMGIPSDEPWLIESTQVREDSRRVEEHNSPIQEAEQEIERAIFTLLQLVLDMEPDTVVAAILGYQDWSWRDSYLQLCTLQRQQRIAAKRSQVVKQISTKVVDSLILGLAQKLSDPDTHENVINNQLRASEVDSESGIRFWRLLWQR